MANDVVQPFPSTPEEFARYCRARVYEFEELPALACFALGMLASTALRDRRVPSAVLLQQAEACRTIRDVDRLDRILNGEGHTP